MSKKIVKFPLTDEERMIRNEELASLVKDANTAVKKAQDFADKYKLRFDLLSYTYYGDPEDRGEYSEDGWYNSSMGC